MKYRITKEKTIEGKDIYSIEIKCLFWWKKMPMAARTEEQARKQIEWLKQDKTIIDY